MIIQVNKGGGIEAVISDIMRDTRELDTGKVSLNPSIDYFAAQKKVVEFLAAQHPELEFETSPATLMVFCPSVVGNTGNSQLVWRTEVGNVGEPIVKELVLLDAYTGEIAFHYSLIYDAKYRMIYDYAGRTYNPVLVRWEGQGSTGIGDVDDTYDYLGDTYDFYFDHHGRDSYDDAGADLIAEYVTGSLEHGGMAPICG
jgi:vibriolysin